MTMYGESRDTAEECGEDLLVFLRLKQSMVVTVCGWWRLIMELLISLFSPH